MVKPITMKLYTCAVYNIRMREDNHGLKNIKGDNSVRDWVSFVI